VQIILANFEVTQDETIYPRLRFEHHMQIVRAMWEFKTYERFKRLNCPVLFLPTRPPQPRSAQEEEFLRLKERGLEQALRHLKEGHLHWMEDTIHDAPLQRPRELAELISDFALSLV
jgi:pimeloyl-ACP methyl ester carboxylesterase